MVWGTLRVRSPRPELRKHMSFTKTAACLSVALALLHVCLSHTEAHTPVRRAPARKSGVQKSVPPKSPARAQPYVAGELLVRYADAKALGAARALNAEAGATVLREFTFAAWQHLKLPAGLG